MATRVELREIFGSIDAMDADAFVSFLTEDAVFRYGSQEAVEGRDAIREYVAQFFTMVRGLRHTLLDTWEGEERLAVRGEVTYQKLDGGEVTLPFVDVLRLSADGIRDYLVYIDPSPLMS